ncbi:MAG: NAD(P)-dependent oxidoreductase [Methylacidiphilales bacterium]|nr:NAD(P)-dependent oxidoreductase [Candidatus Methylacidiphilales bacterium]
MNISLIGYGIIGQAWAQHYQADGHTLKIWNRSPKTVPGYEPNLPKAVAGADVIHIVVADPPAVLEIFTQILPVLTRSMLILQSSTISPESSESFRRMVEQSGASYVEAPFTGSKPAAEKRENVFFLGGSAEAKQRARSVLQPLSKAIFDLGDNRQASTVKLAMNLQIAAICQALSEGLEMSRRAGIPDPVFFDVLAQNVARSGVSDLKKDKLSTAEFSPQFSIKHMHKDLRLALDSAPASTLPLTRRVCEIYTQGMDQGWGDLDFSALIRLLVVHTP